MSRRLFGDKENSLQSKMITALTQHGFTRIGKRLWRLTDEWGRTISFIGIEDSPLDYSVGLSDQEDRAVNNLWKSLRTGEDPVTEFLRSIQKEEEPPKFVFEIELVRIPLSVEPTPRELTILTWGKSRMRRAPKESEKNWRADHITVQGAGIDLDKTTGQSGELQAVIISDSHFVPLMREIVEEIETKEYTSIGIYCLHGRHRSVGIAELLKKWFYPGATLRHLTLY